MSFIQLYISPLFKHGGIAHIVRGRAKQNQHRNYLLAQLQMELAGAGSLIINLQQITEDLEEEGYNNKTYIIIIYHGQK